MPILWDEYDPPSIEPDTKRGFCRHCGCNVDVVPVDYGLGYDDGYGAPMIHEDWQDTCTVCRGTSIEAEHAEETEEVCDESDA